MLEDRDFNEKPYTPDELRVVDYISQITDGMIGAGSDPIGFLLASHNSISQQRRELATLKSDQQSLMFVAKWVERGMFDTLISPKDAIDTIAYYPGMPWMTGRWDVDHKPYANAFYNRFPKAKGQHAP